MAAAVKDSNREKPGLKYRGIAWLQIAK